jgi:predicted component of type VI protein secretion system
MPRARSADELVEFVAADRARVPFLRFFDADGRQRLVTLAPEQPRLTIGRRPGNEVALAWDKQVSAVHAQLEHLAGEWLIADEGLSRNGTFVNGERLSGRRRLRDGDSIGVGETQLAFYAPATRRTSVTSPGQRTLELVTVSSTQSDLLAVLCRPLLDARGLALPTPNKQIAAELHLSVDAVKAQLRALFRKFHLEEAPQNEKRVRLAEAALAAGIVRRPD